MFEFKVLTLSLVRRKIVWSFHLHFRNCIEVLDCRFLTLFEAPHITPCEKSQLSVHLTLRPLKLRQWLTKMKKCTKMKK